MLRVIELFAGIGSQTQALKNIGIGHEVVAISEIDKYAVQSYRALHGGVNNLGDITKIGELPEADLWTYSFPCTDISVAGKLAGCGRNSGTRSGLLWEVERLLKKAQEQGRLPKYLLLENVKNLIGKKFKANYDEWLAFLNSLGYKNYWKVLNAKHYGIPQNRERVFCVSILGDHEPYKFPKEMTLTLRLRDMLEEKVAEKYYINEERVQTMLELHYKRKNSEPECEVVGNLGGKYVKMRECSRRVYGADGLSPTVHTCPGGNTEPKVAYFEPLICAMRGRNPDNPTVRKAGLPTEQMLEVNGKGTANALTTVQKDNLVICEERWDEGIRFFKDECIGAIRTLPSGGDKRVLSVVDEKCEVAKTVRCGGRATLDKKHAWDIIKEVGNYMPSGHEAGRVVDTDYIAPTVKENHGTATAIVEEADGLYTGDSPRFHKPPLKDISRTLKAGLHDAGVQLGADSKTVRVRKLTPRECLRLMGWTDAQIDKITGVKTSSTQMYKQAGNGIVVQVLEAVFKQLFKNSEEDT